MSENEKKRCKIEELEELEKRRIELTDEQSEEVSGGIIDLPTIFYCVPDKLIDADAWQSGGPANEYCPKCGQLMSKSHSVGEIRKLQSEQGYTMYYGYVKWSLH